MTTPTYILAPDGTYWPNLGNASGTSSTHSNVNGDFTATANAAAKTITLSAFMSPTLLASLAARHFACARILRISAAGAVDTLPCTSVVWASPTVTLGDMAANFVAGDTVAMFLPGPEKGTVYQLTPPVRTDGQEGPVLSDPDGMLRNREAYIPQAEDNVNGVIGTTIKPLAVSTYCWTLDKSAALEASTLTKASAGVLFCASFRLDSTAPTNTYYLQFHNAAALPAEGAAVFLCAPTKVVHVTGTDDAVNVVFPGNGVYASLGIVCVLSTTEWTKTISGAYLTGDVFYI